MGFFDTFSLVGRIMFGDSLLSLGVILPMIHYVPMGVFSFAMRWVLSGVCFGLTRLSRLVVFDTLTQFHFLSVFVPLLHCFHMGTSIG